MLAQIFTDDPQGHGEGVRGLFLADLFCFSGNQEGRHNPLAPKYVYIMIFKNTTI